MIIIQIHEEWKKNETRLPTQNMSLFFICISTNIYYAYLLFHNINVCSKRCLKSNKNTGFLFLGMCQIMITLYTLNSYGK